MFDTQTFDLLFTLLLCGMVLLAGGGALWLLPWSNDELAQAERVVLQVSRSASHTAAQGASRYGQLVAHQLAANQLIAGQLVGNQLVGAHLPEPAPRGVAARS